MQRNKVRILSTKAIDDTSIEQLASKNIVAEVASFINTEAISSIELQQEIEYLSTIEATVVFTSVKAVEVVVAELKGYKPVWEIFCIGFATRQAVEEYFGKEFISGTAANASELASLVVEKNGSNEVIFFCGDKRRNELIDILRNNDIEVKEVIVYQTVAVPHKIETKYDGILFFSPSAVKSFFQKNKLTMGTVLFAIGDTTANELRRFSTNKIVVSSQPDKKRLLKKVILYFQENSIHH